MYYLELNISFLDSLRYTDNWKSCLFINRVDQLSHRRIVRVQHIVVMQKLLAAVMTVGCWIRKRCWHFVDWSAAESPSSDSMLDDGSCRQLRRLVPGRLNNRQAIKPRDSSQVKVRKNADKIEIAEWAVMTDRNFSYVFHIRWYKWWWLCRRLFQLIENLNLMAEVVG